MALGRHWGMLKLNATKASQPNPTQANCNKPWIAQEEKENKKRKKKTKPVKEETKEMWKNGIGQTLRDGKDGRNQGNPTQLDPTETNHDSPKRKEETKKKSE